MAYNGISMHWSLLHLEINILTCLYIELMNNRKILVHNHFSFRLQEIYICTIWLKTKTITIRMHSFTIMDGCKINAKGKGKAIRITIPTASSISAPASPYICNLNLECSNYSPRELVVQYASCALTSKLWLKYTIFNLATVLRLWHSYTWFQGKLFLVYSSLAISVLWKVPQVHLSLLEE